MNMLNDTILVSQAALLGDKDAFSQLVKKYLSPIRRFFQNMTGGDVALSKDLTQDVFVKAWLNIGSFGATAKFSTWLYRIAYNVFYDYKRSHKPTVEQDAEYFHDKIASELQDSDFGMDFEKALTILKDDERTVMLLFYMEDQTIAKISKIMGYPSGTVKSHLHRGKEKLTKYFYKFELNNKLLYN
jgi:RNA polymerase sigma-70 factor (ECF subfamily)